MTWEEYYEKIWEWQPSTMVKYISKLSNFGPSEEVMEAIIEISFGDQKGATRMLKKAIDAGVKFNGEQLINMYGNCDESELERAVRFSADQFTDQDIEDLYGSYEDELIIEVAKKAGRKIPDDLCEFYEADMEEDELEDDYIDEEASEPISIAELCNAYDTVLDCLWNAHEKMMLAYRLSISDVGSDKRSISILKHACLLEAEPFINEARSILEEIESQVQDTISIQNTQLNLGKWITFHDVYGDGFLTDWMVQKRIKEMTQAVETACKEIQNLRAKL